MSMRPKETKKDLHVSMSEIKGMLQATETATVTNLDDSSLIKEIQKRGYFVQKHQK